MNAKFTLSCVAGLNRPRINHSIYYGNRDDARIESGRIAKTLALAGYHQFRLFEGDNCITEFEVSTEPSVIAHNIEGKS